MNLEKGGEEVVVAVREGGKEGRKEEEDEKEEEEEEEGGRRYEEVRLEGLEGADVMLHLLTRATNAATDIAPNNRNITDNYEFKTTNI